MKRNKKKYFAFGHVKNKFAHFGCRQQILRRCGGLVIRVLSSRSLVPRGFESRPGASPQCGLRGGRSYCNTVQKKFCFKFSFWRLLFEAKGRHLQKNTFLRPMWIFESENFAVQRRARKWPNSPFSKIAKKCAFLHECIMKWNQVELWHFGFWNIEVLP